MWYLTWLWFDAPGELASGAPRVLNSTPAVAVVSFETTCC